MIVPDRAVTSGTRTQCFCFFCDLRQRQRGSASTVAPHQCWNICDWKTTERDQTKRSRFPLAHIESQENPSFRLWPSRFRKVARPPSDLLNYTQNTKRHTNKMEGTASFRRRHTMFKLCQKIEGFRQASSNSKKNRCPAQLPHASTGGRAALPKSIARSFLWTFPVLLACTGAQWRSVPVSRRLGRSSAEESLHHSRGVGTCCMHSEVPRMRIDDLTDDSFEPWPTLTRKVVHAPPPFDLLNTYPKNHQNPKGSEKPTHTQM